MKLIIQIPCFNEETTLPVTLADLPRSIPGIDTVEWLVIDDGSTDKTSGVAHALGVDHVIRHDTNRGLAAAFMTGIHESLARGADIIVNTDADNQYQAADIIRLLEPILAGRAGFIIGIRPVYQVATIPFLIKLLHKVGSLVVMAASGTKVIDPPSGFRAFTREVAERLQVYNRYTYTIETIIQAGNTGIPIETVDVRINLEKLRPSRLMSSPYSYVMKSSRIILQSVLLYNSRRFLLLFCFPPVLATGIILIFSAVIPVRSAAIIVMVLAVAALIHAAYPVVCSRGVFTSKNTGGRH